MIICLATCGCSKEETPEPEPVTETPAQEITATPEPTPTDEPSPTGEVLTAETTCVLCGRITKCTALIDKVWNSDLAMAVDKAYYLCDNCYPLAEDNQKDLDAYYDVLLALQTFFTSEDILNDYNFYQAFYKTKLESDGNYYMYYEPCYVTLDSKGVHFDFVNAKGEEKIKFGLVPYLGKMYFTNITTSGNEYKIEITYDKSKRSYNIKGISVPKNILDKLG